MNESNREVTERLGIAIADAAVQSAAHHIIERDGWTADDPCYREALEPAFVAILAVLEEKDRLAEHRLTRMEEESRGRVAAEKEVELQKAAVERLERLQAVYEEHQQAHTEAVDECPHGPETWVCCGSCHCVALKERDEARARVAELEKTIGLQAAALDAWKKANPNTDGSALAMMATLRSTAAELTGALADCQIEVAQARAEGRAEGIEAAAKRCCQLRDMIGNTDTERNMDRWEALDDAAEEIRALLPQPEEEGK